MNQCQNNFVLQFYDSIAQGLSSNPYVSLSFFVKLVNDNYLIWEQMLNYITTFGFKSFIDGIAIKPQKIIPTRIPNPSFTN